MKFPRQAKIFRGQLLDAAPVAGVAFLLLIFLQLSSLLYTPGVLVYLKNPAATIRISADGLIHFGASSYTEAQTALLREALRNSPAGPPFDLQVEPATPAKDAARLSEIINHITPGMLVHLRNPAATIRIGEDGLIHFGTNSFTEAEAGRLREALRNSPAAPPFDLQVDSGTPPAVAARASEFVNRIFQIQFPAGPRNLIGTDNPTVLIAVNFLGQYFYDNRIVGERELKDALVRERLRAAALQSKELTLTVAGDEQVNWNAVFRLAQWAREAGIKETVLAERTDKPSASPVSPSP